MLISSEKKKVKKTFHLVKWLFTLAFLGILGLAIWQGAEVSSEPAPEGTLFFCDAEKVKDGTFISRGRTFGNGQTQTDEAAFSGKFSSKTPTGDGLQFSMGIETGILEKGKMYKASVWRLQTIRGESGYLAVSVDEGKAFYKNSNFPVSRNADGWEKLEVTFFVSPDKDWKSFNIHTYSSGDKPVFFDDLKLEMITRSDSETFSPQGLNLILNQNSFQKIGQKREEAMKSGILETGEDDWVNGKLVESGKEVPLAVKVRLKGDWLDHLQGEKWSFRVKVKDPQSWNRLITFSLQTPAARYFLHEWVFHQLLDREDILNTRYDFLHFSLNGKPLGLYAYEEHFEKQLVESRQRREGPIVKFSEAGFWANRKRLSEVLGYIPTDLDNSVGRQENAEILPFGEKQAAKSETLSRQFERAQALMEQYRSGTAAVKDVFDLDRLARYFAICEAIGANHGLIWHNQRFYYNPVIDRLEPIGFDGYVEEPQVKFFFLGQGSTHPEKFDSGDLKIRLFTDLDFSKSYFQYLYKFTSKDYLSSFFESIEQEIAPRLSLIKEEFPDYKFDMNRIIEIAQFTHTQILPLDQSVKAYSSPASDGLQNITLYNVHSIPLQVVGYGGKKKESMQALQPLTLAAQPPRGFWLRTSHSKTDGKFRDFKGIRQLAQNTYLNQEIPRSSRMQVPASAKYVYFQALGVDSVFRAPIFPWKNPDMESPSQELFQRPFLQETSIYTVQDSLVLFRPGNHLVKTDLVFPDGLAVIIQAGTTLDFQNGSMFISRSPVFLQGLADAPIILKSSDKSAKGFTVLQAGNPSKLSYTTFENFGTLDFKGWQLTGAVNFYESDVDLFRCVFRKNHCEDGLNIIRSKFTMEHCLVSQTAFDGFDCDFCIGEIHDSQFFETGNDGMDFSGSVINVYDSHSKNCGDKGLSVGEESQVVVFNGKVENCPIGMASKDFSILVVDNASLSNCEIGFTAYQKKPEFGPAKIIVHKSEERELKRRYKLADGSTIQFENEEDLSH